LFFDLGVDKIRLTGGEPLVRKDVELLAAELGRIPGLRALAVTTNGLLLERKLEALQKAGVTHFNISLDTLMPDRFRAITRRDGLDTVLRAIDLTLKAGYEPVKVNCVVQRDVNDDELADFVRLTRDRPLEIRFIEFMPFGGNAWAKSRFLSYADMIERLETEFDFQRIFDGPNETSKTFRVPGYEGTVGFISSMSDNFCAGCNRLRVTADGNLKVCLFGKTETSLRDAMRVGMTDTQLEDMIRNAVAHKKAAHDGMEALAAKPGRPLRSYPADLGQRSSEQPLHRCRRSGL